MIVFRRYTLPLGYNERNITENLKSKLRQSEVSWTSAFWFL